MCTKCSEAACIFAYYEASLDETKQAPFAFALPIYTTPPASDTLIEFLSANVETISLWTDKHRRQPHMWRAILCVQKLKVYNETHRRTMLKMQTVAQATVGALLPKDLEANA